MIIDGIALFPWMVKIYTSFIRKTKQMRVHPRCANAHNCLGPTLGRWWNTKVSLIYAARLRLAEYCNAWILTSPWLMDPRGLRVTQNAYFSLLTLTKKLLLVTFCDPTAETGVSFRTHGWNGTDGRMDRQTWKLK